MTGARLSKLWDQLTSSYWFVPLLMITAAMGAAVYLAGVDVGERFDVLPFWLDVGEPESARVLLGTIASSTISIATLTFSITIVALTLASGQFGSRLLYSFMRDRANQFSLGAFVGVHAYCILVLRSVRAGDEQAHVPHLAVTVAVALALANIGVLIFFIHHVAQSIQATSVITSVRDDLFASIERFFPEAGEDEPARELPELPPAGTVRAPRAGIVEAIDVDALVELTARHDARLHVGRRPGEHLLERAPIAELRAPEEAGDELLDEIAGHFVLGNRRTLVQDVEFALLQLVEIALRALSPGINDPYTACSCIDELGSGLARIMSKGALPEQALDEAGRVRLVLDPTSFEGLTNAAFDQIRQHGCGHVAVGIRILEVLDELVGLARRPEHVEALRVQADATFSAALRGPLEDVDERALRERYARFEAACGQAHAPD